MGQSVDKAVAWAKRRVARETINDILYEPDLDELGGVADRMMADYRIAVEQRRPREELSWILTGLAGCELAMSRCHNGLDAPTSVDLAGPLYLSGLLMLELSHAAGEGSFYRGVRAVEFRNTQLANALGAVALVYGAWPSESSGVSLGHCLDELIPLVQVRGVQVETLSTLVHAHFDVSGEAGREE